MNDVSIKAILQRIEFLKRLSDNGQHMNIPGLSAGACYELAIELEIFIKAISQIKQQALPDAITDNSESPEFRAGWNECREVMAGMMK
jgi:hypothetical protein